MLEYQKALDLEPISVKAHYKAAESYFKLEQYHAALLEYRVAVFLDSKFVAAHHRLGNLYFKLRQYKAANSQYETALKYNPNFVMAHADKGDVYAVQDRYEEAIAQYRTALELAGITCVSGDLYAGQKRYVKAIAEYRSAIKMDSELLLEHAIIDEPLYSSDSVKDRRRDKRFSLKLPLDVQNKGISYPATTIHVSKRGMLIKIKSPREIEVGDEVDVMSGIYQDGQKIAIRGKVLRMKRKGTENDFLISIELFTGGDANGAWETFMAAEEINIP